MKEYKVLDAKSIVENGVDELNKVAVEGWRVITTLAYGSHLKLLLERDKQ